MVEILFKEPAERLTLGRNGFSQAHGIVVTVQGDVCLEPINSRGDVTKARVVIPMAYARAVAEAVLALAPREPAMMTAHTAPHGLPQAVAAGAGYTVQKSDLGGWFYEDAAGDVSDDFQTEAEAWDYAYREIRAKTPEPGEFSKAILAGYKVEREHGDHWNAHDPEGVEIHPPGADWWAGERAAWEACDRHRMYGTAAPFLIQPDGDTWKWKAVGVPGATWSPPFATRAEAEAEARADLEGR